MYGYPTKVFFPIAITLLNRTYIFEWYIARLVVKTRVTMRLDNVLQHHSRFNS